MEKETTTNEIMEFLRDNMVTKGEFTEEISDIREKMATKEDLRKTELKLIDGF